jgi:DNA-binding MarR family transcriptional regulator
VALARTFQGLKHRLLPLIAADGCTTGQFDTLEVLYHKGPLCVNDLLEKTLTTSGNIDVVLNNLLDKKMISKSPDPEDGRKRIVALTAKGRSYVEKHFPDHVELIGELLSVLSISEKQQLKKLLTKFGKSL